MKRKLMYLMIVFVFFCSTAVPVFALKDAVYLVSNNTFYANPDTGKTDDGGDTSIGEGMSRNVVATQSLYEKRNGKQYVTLRLNMSSYISSVGLFVQSKAGEADAYQSANYEVTGSNKENDTKDYRFEINSSNLYIKTTAYVEPMKRDVIFYVSLDLSQAKEGKGDFSVPAGAEQENAEEKPVPQGTVSKADNPKPVVKEENPAAGKAPSKGEAADAAGLTAESALTEEEKEALDKTEGADDGEKSEDKNSLEENEESQGDQVEKEQKRESKSTTWNIAAGIGVLVLLGAVAVFFLRKRKRK